MILNCLHLSTHEHGTWKENKKYCRVKMAKIIKVKINFMNHQRRNISTEII